MFVKVFVSVRGEGMNKSVEDNLNFFYNENDMKEGIG